MDTNPKILVWNLSDEEMRLFGLFLRDIDGPSLEKIRRDQGHLLVREILFTDKVSSDEFDSNEKVVLHTHASELIALTQLKEYCNEDKINKILWGMHPETMLFVPKGIGLVPYTTPGTDIIAERTIEALKNHDVALWEKHGIFAIGYDIVETFDIIDILAKSAKIFFMCMNAGIEPEGLSDSQLDELRNIDF